MRSSEIALDRDAFLEQFEEWKGFLVRDPLFDNQPLYELREAWQHIGNQALDVFESIYQNADEDAVGMPQINPHFLYAGEQVLRQLLPMPNENFTHPHDYELELIGRQNNVRFLHGNLFVQGNLTLTEGALIVTGNLVVSGTLADQAGMSFLVVGGDLQAKHVVTESTMLIRGSTKIDGLLLGAAGEHGICWTGHDLHAKWQIEDEHPLRCFGQRHAEHYIEADLLEESGDLLQHLFVPEVWLDPEDPTLLDHAAIREGLQMGSPVFHKSINHSSS